MYEHVGRARLAEGMDCVHRLLGVGGLFLNHGIARLRNEPRSDKTLISRYVFPDGELPPVTDAMVAMQGAGFEVRDVESLREHYVLTLRRWLANLDASAGQAAREVGEARLRVWRLYVVGAAQAFANADLSIFQVLAARPGAPHGLPLSRRVLLADPTPSPDPDLESNS
jgi:cyclopropane-fatty-acyl-phospholipid synthase